MKQFANSTRSECRSSQTGASLVIALILMVVATLIGLSGIRSSTLQESIAASSFDRTLAMQNAESGLRAAEQAIIDVFAPPIGTAIWVDCTSSNTDACAYPPFGNGAFNGTNSAWINVPLEFYTNQGITAGSSAQYIIQLEVGNPDPIVDTDRVFRVIARSHEPVVANSGNNENRAIVVLATTLSWSAPTPP